MENKTTHFLKVSLILVSLFSIFIFNVQIICMNLMSTDTIRKLGVVYMSGMSEQVASHFGSIIELRLSQVEALVDAVPPGRFKEGTPLQIELTYNARSAGFEYLAFYTSDGKFHMIYGSQVTADIPQAFHQSVLGGMYNACAGKDEAGIPVVLMGVPAQYPMGDGEMSIGLIAGFPSSYLSDTLEGSIKSNMLEYFIIRDDGSYVLQGSVVEEDNYFDRVNKLYVTFNGKGPEQYSKELRYALEHDKSYTSEVMFSNERWNVYCTNLPNSKWHLLLKMSHNILDETIDILKRRWLIISVVACGLILISLLCVFWGYFRLTRKQMYELNEARKSADQARKSAELASQAKSEFLSNMSHDIRTPMNGIMGMTTIAIDNLDNPPRVLNCLKKINVSSRHLLGLINDMLDLSKIESGRLALHMEPLCLRDVIQSIMTIILPQIHEKHQHFNVYIYDIYNENVCSDKVRLMQILLNILGNAVKFTPEGGIIEADLHEEPSPKGDAYIRSLLHVKDNGIGMSEEFQSRIFDAFSREDNNRVDKTMGAGMGMTIVKYIVDAMGGTIAVKSQQGEGSDFYVAIDMEKAANRDPELKLPRREILVIDDDTTAVGAVGDLLRSLDLQVEWALNIEQAFSMIEEHRSEGKRYHMILVDWDVEGRDGIQTITELRRRFGKEIPTILLSDGEDDELEVEAEEKGIDGFIAKPLFRSNLYYGLRRFAEAEVEVRQPQQEEADVDLTGKRILVAEDNEINWEIVQMMLTEFGIELDWAEDGKICVEKFEESELGWYDAILMDLRMPVMTGFEAASAIRKLEREDAGKIPIIAISADAFPEDIKRCLDCGMNAHTPKPFDLEKVLALLMQYLC